MNKIEQLAKELYAAYCNSHAHWQAVAEKAMELCGPQKGIDWKEGEKHRVVGDNIVFKGPFFPIVHPGAGVETLNFDGNPPPAFTGKPTYPPGYLNQTLDALEVAQGQNRAYMKKVEGLNAALQKCGAEKEDLQYRYTNQSKTNQTLLDRLEDSQRQIPLLEQQLNEALNQRDILRQNLHEMTAAKDLWMKDATAKIQENAKWEEACRVKAERIQSLEDALADQSAHYRNVCGERDKAMEHNEVVQKELRNLSDTWTEVINWVIDNKVGVVGHSFPQIVLQTLQHHAAVVADKDARIRRLKEKLEAAEPFVPTHSQGPSIPLHRELVELKDKLAKADTYIEGLERDVAMLHSAVDNGFIIEINING